MSIFVSYPFKVVSPSSVICKLFAAHSPVILTLQRKDVSVDTTQNSGGFVSVTLLADFFTEVGDVIYIESGAITQACIITAVADLKNFTTDIVYSAATSTGFMNNYTQRKNYYVEVNVVKRDSTLTFTTDLGKLVSRPNTKGVIKADITRLCKESVDMVDVLTHGVINEKDSHLSSVIYAEYIEVWDGSSNSIVPMADMFLANAAMQIGNKYDSNMADYYPVTGGNPLAGFLSASTQVRYYDGYPFDVSFYLPGEFSSSTITRGTIDYVDGVSVGTRSHALDASKYKFINRMLIDMVRTGGSQYKQLVYVASDAVQVTKALSVIDSCICRNPFYIKWVNSLGGWNFFMFSGTQTKGLRTSSMGEFGRYIEELSLAETDTEYLGKESVPHITFGSDSLDTYDIELMESLINSPKVQYLTNPDTWVSDLEKWRTIKIEVGNFNTRETKRAKGKIELRAYMPEIKLQTQ